MYLVDFGFKVVHLVVQEPSKCILRIVPPVLSLDSLTMLKSSPIIVFWLLVMWLVSD